MIMTLFASCMAELVPMQGYDVILVNSPIHHGMTWVCSITPLSSTIHSSAYQVIN